MVRLGRLRRGSAGPTASTERSNEEPAYRQWVINASDAASKAGVNSTPTVLVNGEQVTADGGVDELAAALLDQLG